MNASIYQSPIGNILLEATDDSIIGLNFIDEDIPSSMHELENDMIIQAKKELDEYFRGERKEFAVKLAISGTPFRESCWRELQKIPYGKTISYKDLAVQVGNPKAVRAVGGANHNNAISILIPCHRVIGANGKLVGYGGKLWRKEWLIKHEKKYI